MERRVQCITQNWQRNQMITILTATFNRRILLTRLFESLLCQRCLDFEWVIIDDGSTDGTEDEAQVMIQRALGIFTVRYFVKTNEGKHRAINFGVKKSLGEYVFIVDSDDMLPVNSIETILKWISEVDSDNMFAGVSGLKQMMDGRLLVEDRLPGRSYVDATNLDRDKYGLVYDCAEVYKTSVLEKYPFPEFEGEKFISEISSWNAIARDGLKLRWHFEPVYFCEYQRDGLSANIQVTLSANLKGFAFVVNNEIPSCRLKKRFAYIGQFSAAANCRGLSNSQAAKYLNIFLFEYILVSKLYSMKH